MSVHMAGNSAGYPIPQVSDSSSATILGLRMDPSGAGGGLLHPRTRIAAVRPPRTGTGMEVEPIRDSRLALPRRPVADCRLMTVATTLMKMGPRTRGLARKDLGGLRLRERRRDGDPEGATDLPAMTIRTAIRAVTPIATGETGGAVMAIGVVTVSRPVARRG